MACWALVLAAAPAFAAGEPIVAPIPDWVERLDIPEPNPQLRDRHVQNLLVSSQSLFEEEQANHFAELAFLVQTMTGLQGVGNIVLPWQPDHSELIVHKVQILRGSTVIDLLARGHEFTVLRRENNLESAMLDGTLTAVMQAEGLAIGDILNVALTVRRRPGALGLRGENFFFLTHGNPVGRYFVRQIWPQSRPMRWRGHDRLAEPVVRRTALGTELRLDLRNAEAPEPPEQAPARFALPTTLQITPFRNWAEISALVAPHYARATELAPDSPLRAAIRRIAETSTDPRARAMAALRLVQDEIRYFALVMGDGSYLPATADQTWTRRYGDCKGKTVTLLALLHGLGIEAEAVLVHSTFGDALPERLPQMGLFDHVIVRARIDGRSYWMDGTRNGDRAIDDLASAAFQWGLPLREAGAELEAIPHVPPRLPLGEQVVLYDASGGFDDPVPVTVEMIFRGDMATAMRLAMSQIGRDEFVRRMREDGAELPGREQEIESVDVRDGDEAGTFSVIVTGTTRMPWRRTPGEGSHRFRFSNETIAWNPDFDRPAGPLGDAPFALQAPVHLAATETVILPREGRGFSVEGESFQRTVAGTRIGRTVRIEGGRATAQSVFLRLEREISATQAKSSIEAVRQITDDEAYLIAPRGVAGVEAPDGAEEDDDASHTAGGLIQSGYRKMDEGLLEEALADFDRALELAPDSARAHANRGVALIHLSRLDEAVGALASAMRRDPTDFVVHQGYGMLHLAQGHPEDAIRSLSRSLELDAENAFTRARRAEAYLAVGRIDEALADIDQILTREPAHVGALHTKARIHAWRGESDAAVVALNAMVRDSTDPSLLGTRGEMLVRLGQREAAQEALREAVAALDAQLTRDPVEPQIASAWRGQLLSMGGDTEGAIAAFSEGLAERPDDGQLLNARCWLRATANIQLDLALADCDQALETERNAATLDSRALVKLRLDRLDEAIADADAALALDPRQAASLYVRGIARIRNGDRAGGEADLEAARQLVFDIDAEYRDYGVTP